jgi:hypothetical protein
MFKKIKFKSILIGIVIGVVLTSSVFADISSIQVWFNDIKVSLDGVILEMKDAKGNPVQPMVYNGTTYLPARALCEALGKDIKMNEITNVLEITTPTISTTTNITGKEENVLSESITTIETTTEETLIINDTEYEENGLTIREIGEDKYVEYDDIKGKLENTKYKLDYIIGRTYCSLFKENSDDKYEKIVEEINIYNHKFSPSKYRQLFKNNIMYLEYNDYVSIIKPLIGE